MLADGGTNCGLELQTMNFAIYITMHLLYINFIASPSNGDLRLAGYGATVLWGRVEIYLNGRWGTICDRTFGIKEAEVACKQMGLGYAVNYRANPYQRYTWTMGSYIKLVICNHVANVICYLVLWLPLGPGAT